MFYTENKLFEQHGFQTGLIDSNITSNQTRQNSRKDTDSCYQSITCISIKKQNAFKDLGVNMQLEHCQKEM